MLTLSFTLFTVRALDFSEEPGTKVSGPFLIVYVFMEWLDISRLTLRLPQATEDSHSAGTANQKNNGSSSTRPARLAKTIPGSWT